LQGVIITIKQALSIQCFREIEYFSNAYQVANLMLQRQITKMKAVSEDYYKVKKIVLDYNYQLGRMKAFQFVAQRYKEDNEKIIEDI